MGIDTDKFNKVTDPLNIHKGRAAKWADPLGILTKPKDTTAADAARREAERQARIDATTQQIDALFDAPSRQQQITDFGKAMQDFYLQDLNRQKGDADRNLKFALARSGLIGGSRQIDANRRLGEDYQRGILEAERRAQGAQADLRGADEQSRLNLTALAQSGLNSTSAASQAAAALRANLDAGRAGAKADLLGDFFGDVSTINANSMAAKEKREANKLYANMYGRYSGGLSGGY